jgi:hypothetical protein
MREEQHRFELVAMDALTPRPSARFDSLRRWARYRAIQASGGRPTCGLDTRLIEPTTSSRWAWPPAGAFRAHRSRRPRSFWRAAAGR